MSRWWFVVWGVVLLAACGGPSQYAVNALYDARLQIANAKDEGVGELAPAELQTAQRYFSQAEVAFTEGREQDALRLAHYAQQAVKYASLLSSQHRLDQKTAIAEMDLADVQDREEAALEDRKSAEQELGTLLGEE